MKLKRGDSTFSSPLFLRIPTQNPLKMPNAKTWQIFCWVFFAAPVCPCPSHFCLHPAIFPYMKTTIALVDNLYPLSLLMFDQIVGKKHCQRFIVYKLLNFTKPAYNDTTWRIHPTLCIHFQVMLRCVSILPESTTGKGVKYLWLSCCLNALGVRFC